MIIVSCVIKLTAISKTIFIIKLNNILNLNLNVSFDHGMES